MKDEKLSSEAILGMNFNRIDKILEIFITITKTFRYNLSCLPDSFVYILVDRNVALFILKNEKIVIFIQSKRLKSLKLLLNQSVGVFFSKDHLSHELHNLEYLPFFSDLVENAWAKV